MTNKKILLMIASFMFLVLILPANSDAQGASATGNKPGGPIQTQETEFQGVVAELLECKRKEGVLSVKVAFRNTGDQQQTVNIDTNHGKYDGIYVTADSKKYFVLKDSEGAPLAPKYIEGNLAKGGKLLWWAKFPAPPAEVKKVNLIMLKVLPFEDVPITD